jgi:hypothetical protein
MSASMVKRRELEATLVALEALIKDAKDARIAYNRISTSFTSIKDNSAASRHRAFDHFLEGLMVQIENDEDAAISASQRILGVLKSRRSNSATPQESDVSQHTTSPSLASFSASTSTSPQSTEAKSTASIKSEVPKPSAATPDLSNVSLPQSRAITKVEASKANSTPPAISNITPQQPSACTGSEVSKPSSATPALSNITPQQAFAAAKSKAPKPSSATPALPNIAPQQPSASLTTSRISPIKPKGPVHSADQITSSPYMLKSTHNPSRGDPLPYEIARYIGPYSDSTCIVITLLIKHGGLKHNPAFEKTHNGVPLVENLEYRDYGGITRSIVVQREISKDHNGRGINMPRVSCSQYLDLYNSMLYLNSSDTRTIFRKLLDDLEIAIVNRAAVHAWYAALPPTDERVAHNPKHLAFLQMLEKLEHAINRFLLTNTRQLIQR